MGTENHDPEPGGAQSSDRGEASAVMEPLRLRLSVWFLTEQFTDDELDRVLELLTIPGLRDVGNQVRSLVAPRRKLDSMSILGVQRLGANKIRFFRGRERDEALQYRLKLRGDKTLRYLSEGFDLSRADRADLIMGCDASAQVAPDEGSLLPLAFGASWTFFDESWQQWAAAASDALFDVFVDVAGVSPVMAGRATWADTMNETYNYAANLWRERGSEPFVPGYRTMLFIPPSAVATLGGVDRVVREAPVVRVAEVEGGGVVAMLCRSPDALTDAALQAWRNFLLPVVTLPDFEHARSTWTPTTPTRRPFDVLASDWPYGADAS